MHLKESFTCLLEGMQALVTASTAVAEQADQTANFRPMESIAGKDINSLVQKKTICHDVSQQPHWTTFHHWRRHFPKKHSSDSRIELLASDNSGVLDDLDLHVDVGLHMELFDWSCNSLQTFSQSHTHETQASFLTILFGFIRKSLVTFMSLLGLCRPSQCPGSTWQHGRRRTEGT